MWTVRKRILLVHSTVGIVQAYSSFKIEPLVLAQTAKLAEEAEVRS